MDPSGCNREIVHTPCHRPEKLLNPLKHQLEQVGDCFCLCLGWEVPVTTPQKRPNSMNLHKQPGGVWGLMLECISVPKAVMGQGVWPLLSKATSRGKRPIALTVCVHR